MVKRLETNLRSGSIFFASQIKLWRERRNEKRPHKRDCMEAAKIGPDPRFVRNVKRLEELNISQDFQLFFFYSFNGF